MTSVDLPAKSVCSADGEQKDYKPDESLWFFNQDAAGPFENYPFIERTPETYFENRLDLKGMSPNI